ASSASVVVPAGPTAAGSGLPPAAPPLDPAAPYGAFPSPLGPPPAVTSGSPVGAGGAGERGSLRQPGLSDAAVAQALAGNGIPLVALRAYRNAERRLAQDLPGCGLRWSLLAAIGRVESNHGRFAGAQLLQDGRSDPPIVGVALD